jgi:hypothetical protein
MASGSASSLTDAGPRISRSTMSRRVESASAWKTRSKRPWLSMCLTIVESRPIVKLVVNYLRRAVAARRLATARRYGRYRQARLISIGAVNPALTTMANAIRVGEHLIERLG